MRQYKGISPGSLPPTNAPDFTQRLRNMLASIDNYLHDTGKGFSRIDVGLVPQGSGSAIPFRASVVSNETGSLTASGAITAAAISTKSLALTTPSDFYFDFAGNQGDVLTCDQALGRNKGVWQAPAVTLGANTFTLNQSIVHSTTTGLAVSLLTLSLNGSADGPSFIEGLDSTGVLRWYVDAGGNAIFSQMALFDSTANFIGNFNATAITNNRTWTVPDRDGTIVISGGASVAESLKMAISTTSQLYSTSAAVGACFSDTTTIAKKLRVVLSGASANGHSITLTNTAARDYGLGNIGGNIAIVGANTSAAAAGKITKIDLTAQTTAIGSTNMTSSAPVGMYEVDVVAICTTLSGSGAPTLDVTIGWTDALGATTEKTINALSLSATGRTHGATRLMVSSSEIAYSTTINAASGSPQYALYIRVTYLG